MRKNLHDILALLRFVVARFKQDRCSQAAASLTFTTLLALVPLLTITLTMLSAFHVFDEFAVPIKNDVLNNLLPDKSTLVVTQYMQQFAESASRLTAMGIIFLAVTAMSMMLTIDKAFNVIWRVSQPRPLVKRLIVYWTILTLAPLLIGVSLSLTSWLVGLSMGYAKHIPFLGIGILRVLPIMLTTLAFAMLFKLVPNRYVPRAHALIGALIAALLFESMNRMFAHYISHFSTYKLVYGAFASVPLFLLWIYLGWLTILFGAVVAASLSHWRSQSSSQLTSSARLINALRVLQLMEKSFQQGAVLQFHVLSQQLVLGYDELEWVLDKLADAHLVCKVAADGWVLIRSPEQISATEILHLFVLDSSALLAEKSKDPLQIWLADCAKNLELSSNISLHNLFKQSVACSIK
jgi:membrane protein